MKRATPKFSLIEAMVVVTACAIIGLVGYNLYSAQQARQQQTTTSQQQAAEAPPAISSEADLDTSAKALDQTELDNSLDTTTLEENISQL